MFKNLVSQKLINNGKNADIIGNNSLEDIISFSEDEITRHENNFILLNQNIDLYYENAKKSARLSGLAVSQIRKSKTSDKNLVLEIKEMLDETIQHFNHEAGLKE